MESSINFLRVRRKTLTQIQKNDQKYLRWITTLFAVVLLVTIFLFGTDFFFSRRITTIKNQQDQLIAQINAKKEIEEEFLVLADKAQQIQTLLKKREGRVETVRFFTTLFPDDTITMKEIYFSQEGIFQATVVSKNIFYLKSAFDTLQSPEVKSQFASLSLSDMQRNSVGEYAFQVTVTKKDTQPNPNARN